MNDPTTLAMLFTVAGISLIGVIWLVFTGGREPVQERLNELRTEQQELGAGEPGKKIADLQEFREAWSQKEERRRKLGERLVQAGLYKPNSMFFFYTSQALLGGVPILIGFAAATMGFISLPVALVVGAMTGVGGIIAPGFWLDAQKRARQTVMRRALPDALDLMVICVEAGLSLSSALVRITKELRTAYPMLAMELMIVHREVQLGYTTGEALKRFGDRFDLEEIRSLASVIRQAERFGASIVNALRVHSDTLRHLRLENARERAQKATVKLLFPTVFCVFPSMFVVILGPAVFDILELFDKMKLP